MILQKWQHRADEIGKTTLHVEQSATNEERAEVAQALQIAGCTALTVTYDLQPASGGRFLLTGKLKANVTQNCIVTLEPLEQRILEDLDIEFLPDNLLPQEAEGEQEILTGDNGEPIEDGMINVGRLAFELLSASLDPFPKKQDANFEWEPHATEAERKPAGPFAALGKLKGDD